MHHMHTELYFVCKNLGKSRLLTNLHLHVITEEQVAEFKVAVNDPVIVQVVDTLDGLTMCS